MPSPASVRAMFASIAPRYDLANTVLSFGLHHRWRARAVRESNIGPGDSVLDCATGTGELALRFKRAVGEQGCVVGVDFCEPMLEIAAAKAARRGLEVELRQGDVLALPFDDNEFGCASIAFGIRSIDDKVGCLRELARVVRPGGSVVVLETGQPQGRFFGPLFRWYAKNIMPRVGGWLSGDPEAYRYLPESSAAVPCGEAFEALLEKCGAFSSWQVHPLSRGFCWLYVARVSE